MVKTLLAGLACACALVVVAGAQPTDLDAFMQQVLAKRDENWKKLQQYVLDERETLDVHGPGHAPIFGGRREYTWYIRDGFFVRSPVKFDGVEISEADRRKYEADFLARAKEREKRARRGQAATAGSGDVETPEDALADLGENRAAQGGDINSLLTQTRQPEFISSAYFLRFKFEEGKYALVGRETVDGRETLRIEYYPSKLFTGTDRRRNGRPASDTDRAYDAAFRRLMNKVALVTLWVEPQAHQIVKYTFKNVGFDFLPAQWLVHLDDLNAEMTMGQPFPGIWLPHGLELNVALTLAMGQFDVRYALDYHDYRQADVKTKVTIK